MGFNIFGFNISRGKGHQWSGGANATINGANGLFFQEFGEGAVTVNGAFSLSAYWAGVRRISESVAMLPVDLFKREGNIRTRVDSNLDYILNSEANHKTTSFDYTQILVTSAINYGNGLAIIERDGFGNPTGLVPVIKSYCTPIDYDEELFWHVKIDEDNTLKIMDRDMINLRGFGSDMVLGLSAIDVHKKNLGLAISAQDYGSYFYKNGTRLDGYIEYDGKLDKEVKRRLINDWRENYGPNGSGGTAILDAGTKYTRLGLPPADAEYLQTRKFQVSEIARILGIPSHMINDLDNATFSNIEHQSIEFLTYSLGSWIEKIEQEYRRKLLKESQKNNHYFKHNVNRLLRTDVKAQAEYYRTMSDIGVLSVNEMRDEMDKNSVENGDVRYVQVNRIPTNEIENFYKTKSKQENGKLDK